VGAIPEAVRGQVLEYLRELHAPVYLEAPSGLREERVLADDMPWIAMQYRHFVAGQPIDAA